MTQAKTELLALASRMVNISVFLMLPISVCFRLLQILPYTTCVKVSGQMFFNWLSLELAIKGFQNG